MIERPTLKPAAVPRRLAAAAAAAAIALALAGCATQPPAAPSPPPRVRADLQPEGLTPGLADAAARVQTGAGESADRSKMFKGSGILVGGQAPGGGLAPASGPVAQDRGGNVSLNFEGADVRDVVRNILGDILNQNYVIDPGVGGSVTIRTSSGIPKSALPSTLETLLRMNGATMIFDDEDNLYRIVPAGAAVRGHVTPILGNNQRNLPPGYSVQIVPLRFVSVREMLRLIEPFAKDAQAVRADDLRNMMIISGTERELKHLMDTIALFDVDWMAGMSAGLFTLQSADVKSVGAEIEKLLGQRDQNPLGGLIRIVPIERMNALLVVTPNPMLIDRVRDWIEKLDRGTGGEGVRFYVYNLQNSRAERVGPLLQQAFTGRSTPALSTQAPTLSPGTPAGQIISPPPFQAQPTPLTAPPAVVVQQAPPPPAQQPAQPGTAGGPGGPGGIVRNIQVVADKDNNTLLIVATPAEWTVIEAALRKLDVAARQVMIEMVIAEVSLVDDFQFGVEWYFKNGANQAGGNFRRGTVPGDIFGAIAGTAANVAGAGIGARVPGFNYLLSGLFPGGIQAALSLLGTASNTKIVANPHVAALDNQRSTIKVGDRIPISQQTLVGGTTNAVTTTSQYIDTGVLVAVTPRINAGGLVTMDIQAEVSNPGDVANAGDAPPINTRSLQSIVAVQSGDTLIMGGLIRDTKQQGSEGIPWLTKIPWIGGLFGQQNIKDQRSELVLFVTPRVVETQQDVRNILDELGKRMERLQDVFPKRIGDSADVPPPSRMMTSPPARPAMQPRPAPEPQSSAPPPQFIDLTREAAPAPALVPPASAPTPSVAAPAPAVPAPQAAGGDGMAPASSGTKARPERPRKAGS
ncbi:MAG TPA: type II secretion system secretin GspD [Casimicrobiaceae bacterium]